MFAVRRCCCSLSMPGTHWRSRFLYIVAENDLTKVGIWCKTVVQEFQEPLKKLMAKEQRLAGNLLQIPFTTLNEYLALLKALCLALEPLGKRWLAFLAAAVSDFHLPMNQTATHKIQSSDGPLKLELQQVPKVLKVLKTTWCPQAFIVTFKLETNPDLLEKKARAHIDAKNGYGVQAVVGNILGEHQHKVFLLVARDPSKLHTFQSNGEEIEENLVAAICSEHRLWMQESEEPSQTLAN